MPKTKDIDLRKIPLKTRQQAYAEFRQHTDEVRETLLEILRDDTADKGHRISAGKEILARGWGSVPSYQIIEAVFEHKHDFNPDALKQLPQDKLRDLEATLATLIQVEDAEIIEHGS